MTLHALARAFCARLFQRQQGFIGHARRTVLAREARHTPEAVGCRLWQTHARGVGCGKHTPEAVGGGKHTPVGCGKHTPEAVGCCGAKVSDTYTQAKIHTHAPVDTYDYCRRP